MVMFYYRHSNMKVIFTAQELESFIEATEGTKFSGVQIAEGLVHSYGANLHEDIKSQIELLEEGIDG